MSAEQAPGSCYLCGNDIDPEFPDGTHHSDCPFVTNWWEVLPGQELLCDLCTGVMYPGDHYRRIPSLPEDDPDYDPENVGGDYRRFSKNVCQEDAFLRLIRGSKPLGDQTG